ncbi:kinase-like domain-containing protein [Xylaria intraflava]|nr:kinase-like domain-containing protein [Xylaria intraflava]
MAAQDGSYYGFTDRMLGLGWGFEQYRNNANYRGLPTTQYLNIHRQRWSKLKPGCALCFLGIITDFEALYLVHRVPRVGRPRPGVPRPGPLRSGLIQRAQALPRLDAPAPHDARGTHLRAREVLDNSKIYFSVRPRWEYENVLGYGGNGIAMKFRYRPIGQNPLRLVVKVGLDGWDDQGIRREEKYTRKMHRAAHCVQLITRDRVDLPQSRQWIYDVPERDDSSEDADSSGDESRDDRPNAAYRDKRTRRQRKMNVAAAQLKAQNHRARQLAAEARLNERNIAIRAQQEGGALGGPVMDPFDIYRQDYLLMEFCPYGDLQNLIYRLNEMNRTVPNRVLWGFWLCLVRACVAMQYPPRKFHLKRRDDPPPLVNAQPGVDISAGGKVVGTELYEDIPSARRRWAMKRFVHFDIDPKNIFISELDIDAKDEEHRHIPKLKLGDFGLAEEIKLYKMNDYYLYRRDLAKFGYFAPEQFGVDWDYIAKPDGTAISPTGPEISEQSIAGNYGPHTNVWGIAIVLWQLITKMEGPVPPQLHRGVRGSNIPTHYCPLLLTDDEYAWVDIELRETIARCMAHDPKDRPRPATLLAAAKRGIEKRFGGETNDFIQRWIQDMIFDP